MAECQGFPFSPLGSIPDVIVVENSREGWAITYSPKALQEARLEGALGALIHWRKRSRYDLNVSLALQLTLTDFNPTKRLLIERKGLESLPGWRNYSAALIRLSPATAGGILFKFRRTLFWVSSAFLCPLPSPVGISVEISASTDTTAWEEGQNRQPNSVIHVSYFEISFVRAN